MIYNSCYVLKVIRRVFPSLSIIYISSILKIYFIDYSTWFFCVNTDIEKEDQLLDQLLHLKTVAFEKLKASRQDIILVASLIDRIPNLAGLARTCEVCNHVVVSVLCGFWCWYVHFFSFRWFTVLLIN